MPIPITASMLYDLVHCPHRVFLDLLGDEDGKDPTSRFVELLWERGTAYEKEVIDGLERPFTDLRAAPAGECEKLTDKATSRAIRLEREGRQGDALRCWRELFGNLFPLS